MVRLERMGQRALMVPLGALVRQVIQDRLAQRVRVAQVALLVRPAPVGRWEQLDQPALAAPLAPRVRPARAARRGNRPDRRGRVSNT